MKNYYDYCKKTIAALSLALSLTVGATAAQVQAQEPVLKVGVLQYVEHESLNANYQGFVDGLKEAGYEEGKNLEIDFVNAMADAANLQSMSEKLVNNNDYLFAIATPAAQAVANVVGDKPLYFSSVTDPVAAGLVESLQAPGKDITGTIDAAPIEEQVKLLQGLAPEAKTIGLLYNAGEANSQSEAKRAKAALEAAGLKVEEATVTSTNDINQVMTALTTKVDAIFTITDNTVASAMTLVGDLAKEAKLPLVGGSEDMVKQNGLATYGLNYYNLGKQTAAMLVKQVEEGTAPKDMPVESAAENNLIVNEDFAKAIGIEVGDIKLD